jgi:hypothetical protein
MPILGVKLPFFCSHYSSEGQALEIVLSFKGESAWGKTSISNGSICWWGCSGEVAQEIVQI